MLIFKRDIKDANVFLGGYIKEKAIGDEINTPLEKMIKKANEINEKAFERFDQDFGKGTPERDAFNFIFYHIYRNIRLSFLKILDEFRDAKKKNLNPIVAENLRKFIKPLNDFTNHMEKVKMDDYSKTTELSERLELFRGEAEKYGFLCDLDEEIRYDHVSKDDFEKLLTSLQDVDLDEDVDLPDDLYERELNEINNEDTD